MTPGPSTRSKEKAPPIGGAVSQAQTQLLRSVARAGHLRALEFGLEIAFASRDVILVRRLGVHALMGRLVRRNMSRRAGLLLHAKCLLGIGLQLIARLLGFFRAAPAWA